MEFERSKYHGNYGIKSDKCYKCKEYFKDKSYIFSRTTKKTKKLIQLCGLCHNQVQIEFEWREQVKKSEYQESCYHETCTVERFDFNGRPKVVRCVMCDKENYISYEDED